MVDDNFVNLLSKSDRPGKANLGSGDVFNGFFICKFNRSSRSTAEFFRIYFKISADKNENFSII